MSFFTVHAVSHRGVG